MNECMCERRFRRIRGCWQFRTKGTDRTLPLPPKRMFVCSVAGEWTASGETVRKPFPFFSVFFPHTLIPGVTTRVASLVVSLGLFLAWEGEHKRV